MMMYYAYAVDLVAEDRGLPSPRTEREDEGEGDADEYAGSGPDIAAIEARYGDVIKRGGESNV